MKLHKRMAFSSNIKLRDFCLTQKVFSEKKKTITIHQKTSSIKPKPKHTKIQFALTKKD